MPFFCLVFQPLSAETIKMDLVLQLLSVESTQTRRVLQLLSAEIIKMDLVLQLSRAETTQTRRVFLLSRA